MNIAHLTDVLVIGGLETYIATLLNALSEENNVYLIGQYISLEMKNSLNSKVIVFEKKLDYIEYENFIVENNIQILHGHPADSLGVSTYIGNKLNIPVVCTYHGLWGWNNTIYDKINKLITISDEVKNKVGNVCKFNNKIEVIQNGIDSNRIYYKNIKKNNNTILFLGRIDADKRYSIKHIVKALENLDVVFKIAGAGSHYDTLKSEVSDKVEFLGYVENVNNILNESSIVISTGRGIREALLCGKSCISMDACWYDGIVNESTISELEYANFSGRSKNAVPISSEVIKSDILKLLNENEQIEIEKWSIPYALENYTSDAFVNKHFEIYKNLVR